MTELRKFIAACWRILRRLSGDDAYERYLEHCRSSHKHQLTPLDRATFCREEVQRRWNGVRRCC